MRKGFDKKAKVRFKSCGVTNWTLYILPNIPRSKENQVMKFGQSENNTTRKRQLGNFQVITFYLQIFCFRFSRKT